MSLTFQTFRNSVLASLGSPDIPTSVRGKIVNIVLGHWTFSSSGETPTVDQVQEIYGKDRLSFTERRYAATAIDTVNSMLRIDPSILGELWNFSETAHDIEEQRNVEKDRNRRTYFIVDGPQELPGFPEQAGA